MDTFNSPPELQDNINWMHERKHGFINVGLANANIEHAREIWWSNITENSYKLLKTYWKDLGIHSEL